jgi:hypothetical protein
MRTFENRAFPMMGSTTSGYWPGLGTRFGWSSRLKVMASSDQLRKDGGALSASRGRSRAPSSRVNSKGLGVAAVAPLLARLAARLLPLLAPFVVAVGLLGLAALRGCVLRALALLAVEDRPHGLFSEGEAGGDVEQLVGVRGRAASQLPHEVPARGALEEGMHDL